ncbi:hypothetical protein [Mycobacterium gallinarum]|uniref:hypothetical protein n=1 Tax=Mycobacterium gallinarum TaxID=39689 RepID=UPI0013D60929|nr:hypothetical protein [Mycobacterium gallinarum]
MPCRQSDKRPDPRLWLGCQDAEEIARLDALKAEAEIEEAVYRAEAVERGEPFELPRWYVGGNFFPLPRDHPLRARDVRRVRVYRDDRVVPVYDD